MPRTFDGVDDLIVCAAGGVAGNDGGDCTIAAVLNLTAANLGSPFFAAHSVAGNFSLETFGAEWFYVVNTGVNFATLFTAETGEWQLIAATKATGSSTPRAHKYRYSLDTWAHSSASGPVPDATNPLDAGGSIQIGRWSTAEYTTGDIAVVGAWGRVLTDAEIETLTFSLQAWHSSSPQALWLLDQSDTAQSLVDLTGGGANQSSIVGTTVGSLSVPSFGYGHPILVPHSVPAPPPPPEAEPGVWTAGQPQPKWKAGAPQPKWRAHEPRTKWTAGAPRGG